MRSVVLRRVCCGVAAAVFSTRVFIWALLLYAARDGLATLRYEPRKGLVPGVELTASVPNVRVVIWAWFVAAFAIGFWFGYRYFAKRSSPQNVPEKI